MFALGGRSQRNVDPAPSLWAYRVQRLLLTRGVRKLIRIGAPLLLITLPILVFLSDASRREALDQQIAAMWSTIEQRPEFAVRAMHITGVSEELDGQLREIMGLEFPVSSFQLDLNELRDRLETLGPVKNAELRIGGQGLLEVSITQRLPVAVWRGADGLRLIDETGAIIMVLPQREDRADLPLIAGKDARAHAQEALLLLDAARPIRNQVYGLLRVGERRWDILLDRGRRIMLPVESPISTLETIIVMSETRDLLERDIAAIDLRIPQRPTIRLSETAVAEFRRITATSFETGQQ